MYAHVLSNCSIILLTAADLPTWLNPKPGDSRAPKIFSCPKFFGGPFQGVWGMLLQKNLKINVLRLAENAFPTF